MAQINGSNVMVKFGDDEATAMPLACSTSCTVNINQDFKEVVCKNPTTVEDKGWTNKTPSKKSWDMSIDALYVINTGANEASWKDVVDAILAAKEVQVVFEATDPEAQSGETQAYILKGKAYISNTSLTAPAEEDSTFSLTLDGNGALTSSETPVP